MIGNESAHSPLAQSILPEPLANQLLCLSKPPAAAKAAGCGTVNLFINGFGGATLAQTAWQAGLGRDDTREILGLRWEHNLDSNTIWRTQAVLDDKNISQPTGGTIARGDEPSINIMSDVTSHGTFFGFDTVHFAGIYFNTDSVTNYTNNVAPGGNAQIGAPTQISPTTTTEMGMHGREEIKFTDFLAGVAGLGAEYTNLRGSAENFNYSAAGVPSLAKTSASADNNYYNIAPEGALVYRPQSDWVIKARIATAMERRRSAISSSRPMARPATIRSSNRKPISAMICRRRGRR